jgi:hypothetical protein
VVKDRLMRCGAYEGGADQRMSVLPCLRALQGHDRALGCSPVRVMLGGGSRARIVVANCGGLSIGLIGSSRTVGLSG